MAATSGKITLSGSSQQLLPEGHDRGGIGLGIISTEVGAGWVNFGAPAVVGEGLFVEAGAQLILDGEKKKVIRQSVNVIAASGTPSLSFHEL